MQTKYSKRFLKEAKDLRKKYHKIDEDLLNFVNSLEERKSIGASRIVNLNHLHVYKARVKNSSSLMGKSGGFRIIYYVQIAEENFFLLTIYSKSQKSDISRNEILKILKEENLIQ